MFLVDGDVLLNIIRGSQDHRDPLMDALGLDVQHIHASCGGHSSSLLSDEGHGVALIQESELQHRQSNNSHHSFNKKFLITFFHTFMILLRNSIIKL